MSCHGRRERVSRCAAADACDGWSAVVAWRRTEHASRCAGAGACDGWSAVAAWRRTEHASGCAAADACDASTLGSGASWPTRGAWVRSATGYCAMFLALRRSWRRLAACSALVCSRWRPTWGCTRSGGDLDRRPQGCISVRNCLALGSKSTHESRLRRFRGREAAESRCRCATIRLPRGARHVRGAND